MQQRPYVGEKIELNKKTYRYLKTQIKDEKIEYLFGNVTRHSNISGLGRAYIRELKRIVPYYIVDHKKTGKNVDTLAARSLLDGSALGIGKGGLCKFEACLVRDNKDFVKRIELKNIEPITLESDDE